MSNVEVSTRLIVYVAVMCVISRLVHVDSLHFNVICCTCMWHNSIQYTPN